MQKRSQEKAWIIGYKQQPQAHLRLFCFPSAGAGASSYRSWLSALAPEIEVCPIQLPGRESRIMERPFHRFDELIEALALILQPTLDQPFAFFGHSMGAIIAFGLTEYLMNQKAQLPTHLFLSAYHAPQLPNKESFLALTDDELIAKVTEMNGTPSEVLENVEWHRLLLRFLRADCAIGESYAPTICEPLDIPITVLGGLQDQSVERAELEAWCEQTRGPFKLHMLSGDHFFWYHDPYPAWQIIRSSS